MVKLSKGADGAPREVFSHVEEMRGVGLSVPGTTELLYGLNQAGLELPLTALTVSECADAIVKLWKEGGYGHS